jgi:hypothetical protein
MQDRLSLIDSQKANGFSVPEPWAVARIGISGISSAGSDEAGAGGEDCRDGSVTCEGSVATKGKAGSSAGLGVVVVVVVEVVTMLEIFSSFLSNWRALFERWSSPFAFAGRRRATCSMQSTLAF